VSSAPSREAASSIAVAAIGAGDRVGLLDMAAHDGVVRAGGGKRHLGGLTRLLPWDGRMQLGALAPSLRRFVFVQAVAQPVTVGALFVFGGGPRTFTGLPIVAAAVLGVVAAVIARAMRPALSRG